MSSSCPICMYVQHFPTDASLMFDVYFLDRGLSCAICNVYFPTDGFFLFDLYVQLPHRWLLLYVRFLQGAERGT